MQRSNEGLVDDERCRDWSRRDQAGATGVVTAAMGMRIVGCLLGIVRIARFSVRVFCGCGFWRVVAVVRSNYLVGACLRMMMIAPEQVLDAAIGRRQQPKHDAACRNNAEADVEFWLERNHTLKLLTAIPCRGLAGD